MKNKFTYKLLDIQTEYFKPCIMILVDEDPIGDPIKTLSEAKLICDWLNTIQLEDSDD